MQDSVIVRNSSLGEIVVAKFHCVSYLNCLGFLRKNLLSPTMLKGHAYVPSIFYAEIPVRTGISIFNAS